jgi:dihydroorotate dehydrogenase (NAD+) catalytic subunit
MIVRAGRRNASVAPSRVDLRARVGDVELPNPVMTASGTAGHGAELGAYIPLDALGAVVVKSLAIFPWSGNPAPRLHGTPAGMINSVGLQGPGVEAWLEDELPVLAATGARVVVSIWGRSVDDFAAAARCLATAPPCVVAVEINLSCPNLKGEGMFAQSSVATQEVVAACAAARRPRWAKLTAAVADVAAIAAAARQGGADAVTLVNTLPAMVIDPLARRPVLGAGGGGLSGAAMHPVAVRAVYDVRAALPDLPIVGVGGVARGVDAAELLCAGAAAVQVGTASFADPRASQRVLDELTAWCERHDVASVDALVGTAHSRLGEERHDRR